MLLKIKIKKSLSIIVVGCIPGLAQAQFCLVNEIGWLWWDDKAYMDDGDYTSGPEPFPPYNYTYWFEQAVDVYDATDLDPGVGPNGEGELFMDNANYGNNGSLGAALPSRGSTACAWWVGFVPYPNGSCDYTDRPDNGIMFFNDYYLTTTTYKWSTMPQATMLHELGHLFGMHHAYGGCTSFMENNAYDGMPTSLQLWESHWINNQY